MKRVKERRCGDIEDSIRVRPCRRDDRTDLGRLGHPPDVLRLLCPSVATQIAWACTGTGVRSFLAEDVASGSVCGTVQFVRSRLDPETWMFGHWHVFPGLRRQGVGGSLLRRSLELQPDIRRVFSIVDHANEISIEAHQGLGFETGETLLEAISLGTLSTLGRAARELRLERVPRRSWRGLLGLYARAMGTLWLRLFPRLTEIGPSGEDGLAPFSSAPGGRDRTGRTRIMMARSEGRDAAIVARRGRAITVYVDPGACDAGLLARIATDMMVRGVPRHQAIGLRGVPPHLRERLRPAPLAIVMGLPEARPLLLPGQTP